MKHWLFTAALICFGSVARAQQQQVFSMKGHYVQTFVINPSSSTSVSITDADPKLYDLAVVNLSTHTIFIGTTNATIHNGEHSNITFGFPVLSSGTFRIDGKFSDGLYATCNQPMAACPIRVIKFLVR